MNGTKNRQISRDSLFVLAEMRLEGQEGEHRIKLRNLSAGGMMGEGTVRVTRGALISVHIRNIGWTEGTIAWVQDNRFGVAFAEEIDPKEARLPAKSGNESVILQRVPGQRQSGAVRKV